MNKFFLSIAWLASVISYAQPLNFEWARSIGSESYDYGVSVAVDKDGNVYTAGLFYSTADFDPGPGIYNLTPFGKEDVFILKTDASGNFVWAKQLGGTSYEYLGGLALDSEGNVYTTGGFTNTADFDPGVGVYNLTTGPLNEQDIFISKLDAEGHFIWAKHIGADNYDQGYSIAVDHSGNVYTTGIFSETSDFDPGAGEFFLTSSDGENADAFVLKLSSGGDFLWANKIGGDLYDYGTSVSVDKAGNAYAAGSFIGAVDFDPGPPQLNKTANGASDGYIVKLDPSGHLIWVQTVGGSDGDLVQTLAVDDEDNLIATGGFSGTFDFDFGSGVFNLTGLPDMFVLKLDVNGNFKWATAFGGPNTWVNTTSIDKAGDIYLTGWIMGTINFTVGTETITLNSAGESDVFIAKINDDGNIDWVKNVGSAQQDEASGIAVHSSGTIHVTGFFKSTTDFDPTDGTFNLTPTSPDKADVFLIKLNQQEIAVPPPPVDEGPGEEEEPGEEEHVVGITEYPSDEGTAFYPNPTNGPLTVELPNSAETVRITITNNVGELVLSVNLTAEDRSIDLSPLPNGVYHLLRQTGESITSEKLIKR